EASGTKYVPPHLLESWKERDPVTCYESFLRAEGILSEETIVGMKQEYRNYLEEELREVLVPEYLLADNATELGDVYASVPEARVIAKIDNSTPQLFEAIVNV